jgi:hypothetical protein
MSASKYLKPVEPATGLWAVTAFGLSAEAPNIAIGNIIKVINPEKKRLFAGFPGDSTVCFHGTLENNIFSLAQHGFEIDRSPGGNFGQGVYLTRKGIKAHHYTSKNKEGQRVILQCRVKPGKIKNYPKGVHDPDLKHKGDADSVIGNIAHGEELVVYDPDRVLIEYIIYYSVFQW